MSNAPTPLVFGQVDSALAVAARNARDRAREHAEVAAEAAARVQQVGLVIASAVSGVLNVLPTTGPLTLTEAHSNASIEVTSNNMVPITVPAGLGAFFAVLTQLGDGQVYPVWGAGVSVLGAASGRDRLGTAGPGTRIHIISYGDDVYYIGGDVAQAVPPSFPWLGAPKVLPVREFAAGLYVGLVPFSGTDVVLSISPPSLRIEQRTGQIFTADASLSLQNGPTQPFTVTATNAAGSTTITGAVPLLDVGPPIIAPGQRFVALDSWLDGAVIGTVSVVSDPNTVPPTGWSLVGGPYPLAISAAGVITKSGSMNGLVTPTITVTLRALSVDGPSVDVTAVIDVVAASEVYAPGLAGAAAHWDPADAGLRAILGGTTNELSSITSKLGGGHIWTSASSVNPRPLYEANGINGLPAVRWNNSHRLEALTGNPTFSLLRNTALFGFETVFQLDDASIPAFLLRFARGTANSTWLRIGTVIKAGLTYIQAFGAPLTTGAAVSVDHSTPLAAGVPYYLYTEFDFTSGAIRIVVNAKDETTPVTFTPANGPTADAAPNIVTMGRPTTSIEDRMYFRCADWAIYRAKPNEDARRHNAAILRVKYGALA